MLLSHYQIIEKEVKQNEIGSSIVVTSHPARSRYHYDFHECVEERGWVAYDTVQDTWTFGVWLNESALQILIFADGEETLMTCTTREQFLGELSIMAVIYGQPPIKDYTSANRSA